MNSEDHRHRAQAALNNLKPWLSELQITLTDFMDLVNYLVSLPQLSHNLMFIISKHYVTLGVLSETVMSCHGDCILLQGSPAASAERILWVLLHISLLSRFVSINCPFNLMVSLNIFFLCQTEV